MAAGKTFQFSVRVMLFQEDKTWVAQCLDFDIAAQGMSLDSAMHSFERVFMGQICLDLQQNQQPLDGIPKAPKAFLERFEKSKPLAEKPSFSCPTGILPHRVTATAEDVRIFA